MATTTLGTTTDTSLTAVVFSQDPSVLLPADLATIAHMILNDQNVATPMAQISGIGGFVREGFLFVPNRGKLQIYPGDVIAVDDATGWPILVSAAAAAGADWNLP